MPDISSFYFIVKSGNVDAGKLNAADWIHLIRDCLESCKCLLPQAASKNGQLFSDLLNYSIGSGGTERRITPQEIVNTLPGALIINKKWLFIPVETLETKEEKGQFFERKLFIVADLACLMIMDVAFRKEPLPDQEMAIDVIPKINESVVACQIFVNHNGLGFASEGFDEKLLPYLVDPQRKLGEKIIKHTLDSVVWELRKIREGTQKTEAELKSFLEIRKRLGCIDF